MDKNDPIPDGLIQVAGVHDIEEASMLVDAGVDLVGIPLKLNVNKEDLAEDQAARISKAFPGKCCLITYLNEVDDIVSLVKYLKVKYIQLHGEIRPEILPNLCKILSGVNLIKSLIVGKYPIGELDSQIAQFSPHVSAFITDTYNAATGAEGATGLTHDWSLSRHLVISSPRPVILAGGLNPLNVADAIYKVKPSGVDVHTGVEDKNGRKSEALVRAFVANSRRAFCCY